ncbi:Serine/threonine-protein kinase-like protein CCR4 [Hordeum vulgare]|nr:Serine/threonine-protein kinase-like protein CCR4 [Hordeum vulgare]
MLHASPAQEDLGRRAPALRKKTAAAGLPAHLPPLATPFPSFSPIVLCGCDANDVGCDGDLRQIRSRRRDRGQIHIWGWRGGDLGGVGGGPPTSRPRRRPRWAAAMATARGVEEVVQKLASDRARPRDEGVKLLGTWLQGDRALTFYRLLARNTVRAKPAQLASSHFLFQLTKDFCEMFAESCGTGLELAQRLNIAIDVAHAVTYLHEYAERLVIQHDIRSSNVLLTQALAAKVAGFGMARVSGQFCNAWECSFLAAEPDRI